MKGIFYLSLLLLSISCLRHGDDIAVRGLGCDENDIQNVISGDSLVNDDPVTVTGDTIRTDTFNYHCNYEVITRIHRTANRYKTYSKPITGNNYQAFAVQNYSGQPYQIRIYEDWTDNWFSVFKAYGEWYVEPDTLGYTIHPDGSIYSRSIFWYDTKVVITDTLPYSERSLQRIRDLANTFEKAHSTPHRGWSYNNALKWYEKGEEVMIRRGRYWIRVSGDRVWGEWITGKEKNIDGDVS